MSYAATTSPDFSFYIFTQSTINIVVRWKCAVWAAMEDPDREILDLLENLVRMVVAMERAMKVQQEEQRVQAFEH